MEKEKFEQTLNYLLSFFDDNDVFLDFAENPLNDLTDYDYENANIFINCVEDNDSLNNLVSNIMRCEILHLFISEHNSNFPDYLLKEKDFQVFDNLACCIIERAEILSFDSNFSIEDVIKYGFISADDYLTQMSSDNKLFRFIKKNIIKPVKLVFEKEREKILQL